MDAPPLVVQPDIHLTVHMWFQKAMQIQGAVQERLGHVESAVAAIGPEFGCGRAMVVVVCLFVLLLLLGTSS